MARMSRRNIFEGATAEAERVCQAVLARGREDLKPHARGVAAFIRAARVELAKGDAEKAAGLAFEAGIAWQHACFLWGFGDDARRGAKVVAAAGDGARKTNARHQTQRARRAARMAALAPKIGVEKASWQCEAEGLGTAAAIKRQWYRHTKKV